MVSLEERPRKRQCRNRVRFSEEAPRTLVFNNFAEAQTEEERREICKQVWYTVRALMTFVVK